MQSLSLAWSPRIDGNFITDAPHKLVSGGQMANIPFVTGVRYSSHFTFVVVEPLSQDCDDEGTMFSLSMLNVT